MIVRCPCCGVTRLRVERPEDAEGYRCARGVRASGVKAIALTSAVIGFAAEGTTPSTGTGRADDESIELIVPSAEARLLPVPPPRHRGFESGETAPALLPPVDAADVEKAPEQRRGKRRRDDDVPDARQLAFSFGAPEAATA